MAEIEAVELGLTLIGAGGSSSRVTRSFSIPPAMYHVDASRLTGYSDGDPITNWVDLAGGLGTTQPTTSKRPTFRTNVQNGKPVVRFVRANEQHLVLDANPFVGSAGGTLYMVVKLDPAAGAGVGHPFGQVSGWPSSHYGYNGSTDIYEHWGSTARRLWSASATLHAFRVYEVASGPGYWQSRLNGVVQLTDNTNTVAWDESGPKPLLGADYLSAPSHSWGGDIAEVIGYGELHDQGTRDSIVAHLLDKWGIA